MTPQVVEVRLKRPRPDLLALFAQPEMALLRPYTASGTGPFRIEQPGPQPLLRPIRYPDRTEPDAPSDVRPERDVRLIGERASLAIARFAARRSDLVTGGTFADRPLLAMTNIAPANLRVDPAAGLFGLAIVSREDFLADAAHRNALSAAIDRPAVAGSVLEGWPTAEAFLPEQLDSAMPPVVPDWASQPLAARRAAGAALVREWNKPVRLRVALPAGPGATLIFGQLAASLATIGVGLDRVGFDARADLRLIDAIAPYDSARWYLANACAPCSAEAENALIAARDAPDTAERERLIAVADAALARDVSFIPLARPLRWSLVALRLGRWAPNARAWHVLNRLRIDTISAQ